MRMDEWGLVLHSHGWWHLVWRWRNRRNVLGVTTLSVSEGSASFRCRVCDWHLDAPT